MLGTQFTYVLKTLDFYNLLLIEDKRTGTPVTKHIQEIIKTICATERINPLFTVILYRDEHKFWDGWHEQTKSFILLGTDTAEEAILKLKRKFGDDLRRIFSPNIN